MLIFFWGVFGSLVDYVDIVVVLILLESKGLGFLGVSRFESQTTKRPKPLPSLKLTILPLKKNGPGPQNPTIVFQSSIFRGRTG